MKRTLVSMVLTGGLLAAIFAPAASAAACSAQYTVLPGDNLFRIGVAFGVPWPDIAAANSLTNAGLIFPGQVLCIPGAAGTPAPTATGPTPTASATAAATAAATATATAPATAAPTGQPAPTAVPTVVAPPGFVPPTFSIVSVIKDTSVTIQTANFPANQAFDITMGPISGLGVGSTVIFTINAAQGGAFTTTVNIPAGLAGTPQIAVRMQSASGYYAYNWFWNATAP